MKIALYSGSFDPVHNGHLDIIRRASEIFDTLIVLIADNPNKKYTVSPEDRAELILKAFDENVGLDTQKIEVVILPKAYTVSEFALNEEIDVIIRGVRDFKDLEFENVMSYVNRNNGVETLYMPCNPEYSMISSSMIKDCLKYGILVTRYVPLNIYPYIKKYYSADMKE